MGSLRFDGVLFMVYSQDHPPPHVHARYGHVVAILDLVPGGGVVLSSRRVAYLPPNASRSDLRKIIRSRREHEAELRKLWNETHGEEAQ